MRSAEILRIQPGTLDNTFQSADRDRLTSRGRDDHLTSIGVTPFLMTAFLRDQPKAVPAENAHHFSRSANWEMLTQGSDSSTSLAPFLTSTGEGSNQSARASLAFSIASVSVSPADTQPGSSGKTAEKRFVSGSSSTRRRNFIQPKHSGKGRQRQAARIESAVSVEGKPTKHRKGNGK